MKERFEKNLARLATFDERLCEALTELPPSPRIGVEAPLDGGVAIAVAAPGGGARLTLPDLAPDSLDDRADELESARMTVVLGFGSGRLLAETLRRSAPSGFVLLVEPDIDLFATLLHFIDITPILDDERLALSVGEQPRDAILAQAEKRFGISTFTHVTRVETPGVRSLYADYYAAIDGELEQLLAFAEQNRIALAEQGMLWRKNILSNLSAIVSSPPVSDLFDSGKGGGAILISAGPSLDRTMPMIAAAKGKIPLIAVDTALKPLAASGIAPDIVVSLDANKVNLEHLEGVDLTDTLLVLHPAVYPAIAQLPCRGRLFFSAPDPLIDFVERIIGSRGEVLTGGTVAASTFDLARKMGLSPLIFCGQDLSFTDEMSHATGAAFNQSKADAFIGDLRYVDDMFGRPMKSNTKMLAWRRWFEIAIPQHRVTAMNATGGGLPIEGAPALSLAEAVARYGALPFPAIGALTPNADIETLADELQATLAETRNVKSVCGKGIAAIKKQAPISQISQLAQKTLENERFVEINRYWVDEALNEIDTLQRGLRSAAHHRKEGLTREAWRRLFTHLYDTAVGFDRDLADAIRSLKAGNPA